MTFDFRKRTQNRRAFGAEEGGLQTRLGSLLLCRGYYTLQLKGRELGSLVRLTPESVLMLMFSLFKITLKRTDESKNPIPSTVDVRNVLFYIYLIFNKINLFCRFVTRGFPGLFSEMSLHLHTT